MLALLVQDVACVGFYGLSLLLMFIETLSKSKTACKDLEYLSNHANSLHGDLTSSGLKVPEFRKFCKVPEFGKSRKR